MTVGIGERGDGLGLRLLKLRRMWVTFAFIADTTGMQLMELEGHMTLARSKDGLLAES
jgi:hypothetical protein